MPPQVGLIALPNSGCFGMNSDPEYGAYGRAATEPLLAGLRSEDRRGLTIQTTPLRAIDVAFAEPAH